MASELGLTRDNSETLGFVLTCRFSSAINQEELKDWCYQVIGELEPGEPPAYLFDLAEYRGPLTGIDRLVGFVPSWKHADEDEDAIYGIAARRGAVVFDWPLDEAAALAALAGNPAIEGRFRQTFPFIAF